VGLSLASRALGVVRESAIVALLGVHDFTDAYFATSTVVLWLQNFCFGAFILYFVPRHLSLRGPARRSWRRRWMRLAALAGALGGGAFFVAYGRIEEALLSGRSVLGATPAAMLALAVPATTIGSILYGRVVSTTRGIAVAALANVLANLAGLGVLVAIIWARLDPSWALPASLAGTQVALLVALALGARAEPADDGVAPGHDRAAESQLGATAAENAGFNVSAIMQQGIAGHLSAGAVTLNAYAVRLLLVPVTGLLQPVQQRLLIGFATDPGAASRRTARLTVAGGLLMGTAAGAAFAAALAASRPWWSPAWQRAFAEHQYAYVLLAYGVYAGVVFSNQSLARLCFASGQGWRYAIAMNGAYAGGTFLRIALAPHWGIVALPLGALAAEGAALAWLYGAIGLAGARRPLPGVAR
jgi:hypothetical protein